LLCSAGTDLCDYHFRNYRTVFSHIWCYFEYRLGLYTSVVAEQSSIRVMYLTLKLISFLGSDWTDFYSLGDYTDAFLLNLRLLLSLSYFPWLMG
jgi:hypothetical protein